MEEISTRAGRLLTEPAPTTPWGARSRPHAVSLTASPIWSTVRALLPLVLLVNVALFGLEQFGGSTVSGGVALVGGAAMSMASGCVARGRGGHRVQAIWAAWWLGACGVALNWFEGVVGLRPSQPLAPLPVPPGVSPLIRGADPSTLSTVLNVFIVVVILIGTLGVVVVAPLAVLGN